PTSPPPSDVLSGDPGGPFQKPLSAADRKVDDPIPADPVFGGSAFALVVQKLVALGDVVRDDYREVLMAVVHDGVGAASAAAQAQSIQHVVLKLILEALVIPVLHFELN